MTQNSYELLPSLDALLRRDEAAGLMENFGRDQLAGAARAELNELRDRIRSGAEKPVSPDELDPGRILARAGDRLRRKLSPSLRKAVNATGIILHTGLGRAVLSREAVDAVRQVIEGYCTLAVDRESGRRGHRDEHLDRLLCELTGAEAATVVNNNAAATVLVLNTLSRGREVVISRGQLIEIGGAFRMPEVMESSGAVMREVGTTNKTHLRDYAAAIGESTGAIMRVHHSNFRIKGFFSEPSILELVELGRRHRIPVIDDLGSGALVDLSRYGLESEPLVRESLAAGADVACFSGDKLIGGGQSGVIVGRREWIELIRRNPLARAFRIDKTTIAALEATLKLFLDPQSLERRHPLYRMLSMPLQRISSRARRLAAAVRPLLPPEVSLEVRSDSSQVGSGSVPAEAIPTRVLSLFSPRISAERIARELRRGDPPIFARVQRDRVLFDLRTLLPGEDRLLPPALAKVFHEREHEE